MYSYKRHYFLKYRLSTVFSVACGQGDWDECIRSHICTRFGAYLHSKMLCRIISNHMLLILYPNVHVCMVLVCYSYVLRPMDPYVLVYWSYITCSTCVVYSGIIVMVHVQAPLHIQLLLDCFMAQFIRRISVIKLYQRDFCGLNDIRCNWNAMYKLDLSWFTVRQTQYRQK